MTDPIDFGVYNDAETKSILSTLTILEKRIKEISTQLRAHLMDRIEPGNPENAMIGETVAATITRTKDGTGKYVVKDPEAYAQWLIAHDDTDHVVEVSIPAPEAQENSYINALVERLSPGEIPAGTDWKDGVHATIKVSLEKGILDEPLDLSSVPFLAPLLGIEAQTDRPSDPSDEQLVTTEGGFPWEVN